MMELINARVIDGSVRPFGKPIPLVTGLTGVRRVYYHDLAKKIIVLGEDYVSALDEDYSFYEQLSTDLGSNVNDIAILGNVLCFLTDSAMLYAIWGGSTYKYIGEIPDLPELTITQTNKVSSALPNSPYLSYGDSVIDAEKIGDGTSSSTMYKELDDEDDFAQAAMYVADGFFDNAIDSLNKDEYMFGACLLKYAFRTSSGAYIKESAPVIVENVGLITVGANAMTDSDGNYIWYTLSQACPLVYFWYEINESHNDDYGKLMGESTSMPIMYAFGTKLTFSFDDYDLSYLDSLIVAIDVFVSPISWYKKEECKFNTTAYYRYVRQNEREQILAASVFYKVAEYDMTGEEIWRLDDWSKDNIALQDQLTTTTYASTFSASTSYTYNSRIHLANATYEFNKGHKWGYDDLSHGVQSKSRTGYAFTTLATEYGTSVVMQKFAFCGAFAPFLTYPDSRATKMELFYTYGGTTTYRSLALKKHPVLDIAYYLQDKERYDEDTYSPITLTTSLTLSITDVDDYLNTEAYYLKDGWTVGTIGDDLAYPDEVNTSYSLPNVVRVSAANDPLSFPVAQTYNVGNGNIVGLCSNVTALSQGQFGEHPVYVFASDGVFALNVDSSGSTAYLSAVPVSRDVCAGYRSIKGVDQGVVFATERGLMLISGTQVVCLSDAMRGKLPACFDYSTVLMNIVEQVAQMYEDSSETDDDGNETTTREYLISSTEFRYYLTDAEVGYNYVEQEIIVGNPNYPYSYVYNLASQTWAKIAFRVDSFTSKYPGCYAVAVSDSSGSTTEYGIYDMHNPYRTVARVLLMTRPIKMGSNALKRVAQSALRGEVHGAQSTLYLRGEALQLNDEDLTLFTNVGLYLLASKDAVRFHLLAKRENVTDLRDLISTMNVSKAYKYFMVVLAGGVRTDVAFNYMEFLAEEVYTNRLR